MAIGRVPRSGRGRLLAALALFASTVMFGLPAKPAAAAPGMTGTVGAPSSTVFGKNVTFSGTITNTGSDASEAFTAVAITSVASSGLLVNPVVAVGAVPPGGSVPFTVTATVNGTPGTPAQLRLRAIAVGVGAPRFDIIGTPFTVTDAVTLAVTAQRLQAGAPSPCPGPPNSPVCTVSVDDNIRYTLTLANRSDVTATDVKITALPPTNTTDVAGLSPVPAGPISVPANSPAMTFVREVAVGNGPPAPGAVLTFLATVTYDASIGLIPVTLNDRAAAGSPASSMSNVVDPRLTITNGPVDAKAVSTNKDPSLPNEAPKVLATVVQQQVDLSVTSAAAAIFTTPTPGNLTATGPFTITVTNGGPFPANTYKVTVDVGAATPANLTLTTTEPGCAVAGNIVTCNGAALPPSASKSFLVTVAISTPGPIAVHSKVVLLDPIQIDPVGTNDDDSRSLTRNLPPDAKADVGPTIPDGATLTFDVLKNDTDGDAADVANLTPDLTGLTGNDAMAVTLDGKQVKVVVPATQTPGTFTLVYNVVDGRGGRTQVTLKVKIVGPVVFNQPAPPRKAAEGSFGRTPSPIPRSFGTDISADKVGPSVSAMDVVNGDLALDADGAAFPATPGLTYALVDVNKSSVNVQGVGGALDVDSSSGKPLIRYVPVPGYTSDAPAPTATGVTQAPPDSFLYTTAGKSGASTIFTVVAPLSVEIRNQNPIGVDETIDILNNRTSLATPAFNDLDGNSVKDPIAVNLDRSGQPGKTFTFHDDGRKDDGSIDPSRGLTIRCIGPVPVDRDPATNLPTKAPDFFCPNTGANQEGFVNAGDDLKLKAADSNGTITLKLAKAASAGVEAFRTVTISADATVVGTLPFAYIVVDSYGGAGFGESTVNVPNTPPVPVPIRQVVLKNTPKIVVDTSKSAATDANNDTIVVSAVPERAEHGRLAADKDHQRILYSPDTDYSGPDSFIYSVSDGRRDGSASAELPINVIEPQGVIPLAAGGATSAGAAAGSSSGSLAKTGGDPVPLTAAAGCSMVLGLALVQAGRRRQSRPLLAQARHLRR